MNTRLFYYLVEQSNPVFRELYSTTQLEYTINETKFTEVWREGLCCRVQVTISLRDIHVRNVTHNVKVI